MTGLSRRHAYLLGSLGILLLALWMAWYMGPFPVPWNDELVFTDIGNRFLQSGRLTESFWAMYDSRFGEGLVNTPPLYPIFVGLLRLAAGGSLMVMRMVHGGLLVCGMSIWIHSRLDSLPEDRIPRTVSALAVLLALVANPYFLRAAFFIRPDGFILLAFLWILGHIWTGTFLADRQNALKAGIVMGLAGQTHFSALVLLPLFGFGLALAFRKWGRATLKPLGRAVLTGTLLMGPYLAWFLPRLPGWWKLVQATQGSQKYAHPQSLGLYLWPPDLLLGRLPVQDWAPAAWGPTATYHLWILAAAALPLAAGRLGVRHRSAARGLTLWVVGMLGTWFFIRLPEMWFSTLAVVSIQMAWTMFLWEELGPRKTALIQGGLVMFHLASLGLFLEDSGLPSWPAHREAISRIETILEKGVRGGPGRIYVSALPDPAVDLVARWPGLRVTRGMDFPSYHAAYADRVLGEPQAWILGEPMVRPRGEEPPRAFLFDWDGALMQAVQRGELDLHPVPWGAYRIWVATRRPDAPMRPSPVAQGPAFAGSSAP